MKMVGSGSFKIFGFFFAKRFAFEHIYVYNCYCKPSIFRSARTSCTTSEDPPVRTKEKSGSLLCIQAYMPYEPSEVSSNQTDGVRTQEVLRPRGQREFSIPGILDESQLHFFSLDLEK